MVFEGEIRNFRVLFKNKYCFLVFFVLFNNVLNVKDILEIDDLREKFEFVLRLCGLKRSIVFYIIGDVFEIFYGFFVKKVGDIYYFFYDFVMEVINFVFGIDYFRVMIKFVDIGLFRKSVRL